mgnify:CR=1 FL=1
MTTMLPILQLLLCLIILAPSANGFSSSLRMSAATGNQNQNKVNVIAGATGYIGKSVVRESVRQGYKTVALVRDLEKVRSPEGNALYGEFFEGADVVQCDVGKPEQLLEVRTYSSTSSVCSSFWFGYFSYTVIVVCC